MKRKLFCEISPFTYRHSMEKEILKRHLKDFLQGARFAKERSESTLPVLVYRHNSLIRRRLGNVNMQLQEKQGYQSALAVPHINGLIIRPGETFSVWKQVGRTTKRKGYKEGLTIAKGQPSQGIGGGLCQLSNLIHWLILHSELTITEHHHHISFQTLADRFPSEQAQISHTTTSTIVSRTKRQTLTNSAYGWMTNICMANYVLKKCSHTPFISMPRMSIFLVREVSFIETDKSIGISLTALQAVVLKVNSSARTMPE